MKLSIVQMAIIISNQTAHAMLAKPIVKHVLMLILVPIVTMAIISLAAHAFSAILTVGYVKNLVLVRQQLIQTTCVPKAFLLLMMMKAHVLRATLTASRAKTLLINALFVVKVIG
jgi:hypothetical protein